jgi:hypothetical protein
VGYLWPKARSPKHTQSRGIGSQPSRIPSHGNHQKHSNRSCFGGFVGQDHQAKIHKVLICDIQQESLKETAQNFPTKIPRKGTENHQKGKTGGTQSSLKEPRRIIYTYHERFIQGLAFSRSSFLSQDLTMKLSS